MDGDKNIYLSMKSLGKVIPNRYNEGWSHFLSIKVVEDYNCYMMTRFQNIHYSDDDRINCTSLQWHKQSWNRYRTRCHRGQALA